MLASADLMAFIPIRDPQVAKAFYVDVLGLAVVEENPAAVVLDAHGVMLLLTPVPDLSPQAFTIAGWRVADIGSTITELMARGVTFTRYDGMDQDDLGIWTTPGGDQVAWFRDPDGNTLSLTTFA